LNEFDKLVCGVTINVASDLSGVVLHLQRTSARRAPWHHRLFSRMVLHLQPGSARPEPQTPPASAVWSFNFNLSHLLRVPRHHRLQPRGTSISTYEHATRTPDTTGFSRVVLHL